jgi:hypothetical protein
MKGPRTHLPAVLAMLLGASLALPAAAQQQPDKDDQTDGQDLYREAMQSLADGRKQDALEGFQRVIDKQPMHAGSLLEIALIQCGLGNSDEAEKLFATIETRFNPPPGIIEVIANAREAGCQHWQALSSSSLMFGRGIDQNVNQGASVPNYTVERDGGQIELPLLPDFLPKHDQYSMMAAEFMHEVTSNGSLGFAQFQARRNDRLRQYDSASLYLGVETPYRVGRWTLRTTSMLGLTSLGGQFYQRQLQLQARIGPPLPLPNSTQFTMMGGITHTQYLTLTNFNSNTFELRGQFTYRNDDMFSSLSLGYQDDRASAERPGGSRRGFSTNLLLRHALGASMTGELAYTRQGWNSALAYAPGLIDQVREQATHVVRGTLTYPLTKSQSLQLEARVVRNKENISVFQYNNRQLQLSWLWQPP